VATPALCPAPLVNAHPVIFNARRLWDLIPKVTIHMPAPRLAARSLVPRPNLAPMYATLCNKTSLMEHLVKEVGNVRTVNARARAWVRRLRAGYIVTEHL